MEKWSIRPAPTLFDPLRHVLLVKGSMKDIAAFLRRFGALCGRPSPENSSEGFNFSLPLHGVTSDAMERLSAVLNEMSAVTSPAAAAAPTPMTPSPFGEPPVPGPEPEVLPQLVSLSPELVPVVAEPPAVAPPPLPPPPPPPEVVAPELALPPAPGPALAPVFAEPVAAASPLKAAVKPFWGFQRALDALQTFDTLLVGPYNRFAHAASTSIVSAPGAMYNPLFLYGSPGTGKTHFMNSIGKGLAGMFSEDTVLLTSGARLGSAVSQSLEAGRFAEFKEFLAKAKALLVDDIHLVAVTDQNRGALAEIFSLFFSGNHQVVLSSIYPPRALSGLEEALKISLAKGWGVDLKTPSVVVQVEIIQSWLDHHRYQLTTDDTRMFHERLGLGYPEVLRWMTRLATIGKVFQQQGQEKKHSDLLHVLFDPGVAPADLPSEIELEQAKDFAPPAPAPDAMKLAFIVPKGQERMAGFMAKAFYQAAAHYGIKQSYRHVLLQSYDASQPFGVPFQLGDACQRAGAQGALILGPPQESGLAAKSGEFSHAVTHILESLDIMCGWIAHQGAMAPAPYLRAHLDLLSNRL